MNLVLALIFSSLLVAAYAVYGPESGSSDLASKQKAEADERIQRISNKHLFMTAKELEISAQKRRAENLMQAPYVGQKLIDLTHGPQKGIDHSSDRNEETAYRDLRRDDVVFDPSNPQHVVQSQLREKQEMAAYEEAFRKEYARKFIENARREGYDVRLSADLVVLSVRKIKTMPK